MADWSVQALERPLSVKTQVGALGEFEVTTRSSVGRELVFLASHTAHHFAVLQAYCEQLGLCAPAELGKAPSTLAHERAVRSEPLIPSLPGSVMSTPASRCLHPSPAQAHA